MTSIQAVLDYVCMENDHKAGVKNMYIDEKGILGGGSDHVWIIVDIVDEYVRIKKEVKRPRKKVWDFDCSTDWKMYKEALDSKLSMINSNDPKELGKKVNEAIYESLEEGIGSAQVGAKDKKRFPKVVLDKLRGAIKKKRRKKWDFVL